MPEPSLPSSSRLLDVLKDSVREIFESMVIAFREDGAPEGRLEGRIDDRTEARVDFQGPLAGCVVLRCTEEGAASIARGLLLIGADEPVGPSEVADSLGECANLVTGRVKTIALDPHGAFTMGTPVVERGPSDRDARSLGALVYRLQSGSVAAEIWLRADA